EDAVHARRLLPRRFLAAEAEAVVRGLLRRSGRSLEARLERVSEVRMRDVARVRLLAGALDRAVLQRVERDLVQEAGRVRLGLERGIALLRSQDRVRDAR